VAPQTKKLYPLYGFLKNPPLSSERTARYINHLIKFRAYGMALFTLYFTGKTCSALFHLAKAKLKARQANNAIPDERAPLEQEAEDQRTQASTDFWDGAKTLGWGYLGLNLITLPSVGYLTLFAGE
jgi:hypothetical protein